MRHKVNRLEIEVQEEGRQASSPGAHPATEVLGCPVSVAEKASNGQVEAGCPGFDAVS